MLIKKGSFTSESVTEGHPDKICDQISDSVLDAVLALDENGKVACETLVGKDFIVLTGEITGKNSDTISYEKIVKDVLKKIGYVDKSLGMDFKTCEIILKINKQSSDISNLVNNKNHTGAGTGAGDQGMMFGFATNETASFMPLAIDLSHKLTQKLTYVRKNDSRSLLGVDGKAQVTICYENGKPKHIDNIVLALHHFEEFALNDVQDFLKKEVINTVIAENSLSNLISDKTKYLINKAGEFNIGGPEADTGLTGRKIIVDTYGGFAHHGGGAFSGKDATKVDRSGAYIARYIAKNIVASGLADICEIQLAYVIGKPTPISIYVDTFNTGKVDNKTIAKIIEDNFKFSVEDIIKYLKLNKPIFYPTSTYGHFGRTPYTKDGLEFFTWEKTDKLDLLKKTIS